MLPRPPRSLLALVLATSALGVACAGQNAASRLAHPPDWKPEGQTKCSVESSQRRPLIVEWPSPDRGALEAQAKKGLVAVRYTGCEMEVLRQCKLPGTYGYTPVTRKADHIAIKNADELYASIPIHAAQFEAKLQQSGELDVNMTIVGSYEADRAAVRVDELSGNCKDATHFISAITAGAFEFSAGAAANVGGGASVGSLGAGADSTAEREVLNRDGYKAACDRATGSDKEPPDGCGALLRVEVVPLGEASGPPPALASEPSLGGLGLQGASQGGTVGIYMPASIPLEPLPPPRSSTASTLGTIGITAGSLGLLTWAITGFVAILEKPSLSTKCSNGVCPPGASGTLSTYNTMGTIATVSLIGGATLLVGGIVAKAVAPGAPKKAPAKHATTVTFDGAGVSGSF